MTERQRSSLPTLLTAQEVAEATKISVKTIYRYAQQGLIPYVRIQSNLRFHEAEIREWIEEQTYRIRLRGGRR